MSSGAQKARRTLGLAVLLLCLGTLILTSAQKPGKTGPSETGTSPGEQERLLAIGRELFVQRCSSCHGEQGEKPLRIGPPLTERKLASIEIARAVGGRLKDATEEEKRAVTLYVKSFMKKN